MREQEVLRVPPPQLHWLPSLPSWEERLKQLKNADISAWEELIALSNCNLDLVDTMRLDRKLTQLFGKCAPPAIGTKPVRMALLSSSTVDHLKPALRVGALRHGIWLDIFTPGYGQYYSELRDESSALFAYRPDCILFALDTQHVPPASIHLVRAVWYRLNLSGSVVKSAKTGSLQERHSAAQ
jgi:hypothetical protein